MMKMLSLLEKWFGRLRHKESRHVGVIRTLAFYGPAIASSMATWRKGLET